MKLLKSTTSSKAEDYDKNILINIPFYTEVLEQILDLVGAVKRDNFKWLDTRCGTGELARLAIETFPKCKLTLCDPLNDMLNIAKEKLNGYTQVEEFHCVLSQELDFNSKFDVVTAVQCHHYLDEAQRKIAV